MEIISQFKGLSISGWTDEYLLHSTKDIGETYRIIHDFFGIEGGGKDYEGFSFFERGSTLGTWIAHSEKAPKQTVYFKDTSKGILLRYKIHAGLILRLPPCGLEKEASALELLLK